MVEEQAQPGRPAPSRRNSNAADNTAVAYSRLCVVSIGVASRSGGICPTDPRSTGRESSAVESAWSAGLSEKAAAQGGNRHDQALLGGRHSRIPTVRGAAGRL